MHTPEGLAKKYNLERYLENPGELNEAIFNLMLLQETVQLEQARKRKRDQPDDAVISAKRSVLGNFTAACTGEGKYRYAVETALKAGTMVLAVFQRSRFIQVLRSMGVSEDKIAAFCSTVTIDDNTRCVDPE